MHRVLLTGGAGFIGHHVAEHILKTSDAGIVFLDRLDCSGTLNRIAQIADWNKHRSRCAWVWHDLRAPINDTVRALIGEIDVILHLAAATHVDRSITDPMSFVLDNVVATCNLLDYARTSIYTPRVIHFSTDEVFGPAPAGAAYREDDRYRSGNPYAATKAGAEELAIAYHNTYGLEVSVIHCMNVFGERQHPEKFIPSTVRKISRGEMVTIHADKTRTVPGSRFYIHARNVAAGIGHVLALRMHGEKFNIVGEREVDNLELAQLIARFVGKPLRYEMVDFHSSRPGHDLRYALDGSKMSKYGWHLPVAFERSLEKTVGWFLQHKEWLHVGDEAKNQTDQDRAEGSRRSAAA